jgi:hypothetical protein
VRTVSTGERTRRSQLEIEQRLLNERLSQLRIAIDTLRRADKLKPDSAARLALYEVNEQKLCFERDRNQREIDDLVLEEAERSVAPPSAL